MKKIIVCLTVLLLNSCPCVNAEDNINYCNRFYSSDFRKNIYDSLNFSENQIFRKTYNNNNLSERLERLELNVYGAIQEGNELTRINNIKNALTNISSGGKGLQYQNKIFDLIKNENSSNNIYFKNHSNNYNSHRIPYPRHYHSHRLYPENQYSQSNSNITNGFYSPNFTMGTGVKILSD